MSTSYRAICRRCGLATHDESHSPIQLEELHVFIYNHKCPIEERGQGRSFEIIDEYNPRHGRFCDHGYEHDPLRNVCDMGYPHKESGEE